MIKGSLSKALKLLVLLTLTGAGLCLYGQSKRPDGPPVAALFDEFGAVGYCDLSARLDNFAILLQDNPRHHGYITQKAVQPTIANESKSADSRAVSTKKP